MKSSSKHKLGTVLFSVGIIMTILSACMYRFAHILVLDSEATDLVSQAALYSAGIFIVVCLVGGVLRSWNSKHDPDTP